MSMLDSFFSRGFKAAKCKTLLKLSIPRIRLLRNKREAQLKQMRRDIAKLLETGQEATARIRVEHVIREQNLMAAQEIIELFCELISVRLPIIEAQRECPLDLKEAISSVCFAAPRCADLPELQQVQMLFAMKYGKEFVSGATDLVPNCGVNRQLIELLSVRAPPPDVKLKLLKEIAEEHELDWDPASSETEFFKPHEDLLNGPTQFISGSKQPLPEEKHTGSFLSSSDESSKRQSISEDDFDLADFPQVPKVPLKPATGEDESPSSDGQLHEQREVTTVSPVPEEREVTTVTRFPEQREDTSDSLGYTEKQSPPSVNTGSETKGGDHLDLQDVLAAAQAAAESAERAAAAARSAASLAEVKISEIMKNKRNRAPETEYSNPFHSKLDPGEGQKGNFSPDHGQRGNFGFDQGEGGDLAFNSGPKGDTAFDEAEELGGNLTFDQGYGGNLDLDRVYEEHHASRPSSYDSYKVGSQFSHRLNEHGSVEASSPMDDDSYFSYPNLFKSEVLEARSTAGATSSTNVSGFDQHR